ncbi:MAG: RNA methyltransferase [Campylobacterota bacterium]|nr:RNA methyltransferase [Campylobacterota bacterium]
MSINYLHVESVNLDELNCYRTLRESISASDNSFVADSPKVVNTLLQADIRVKSILATREYYEEHKEFLSSKDIPLAYVLDKAHMQKIVGHKIHHNCMMNGIRPSQTRLEDLDENIIMLDDITSTENIGSIARSAAALGVTSYLLPKSSPHPYSRRSLRVSMGHMSKLKYHIYKDILVSIGQLQKSGYKVFAAEITKDSVALRKVKPPKKWVLLMGHEGRGISKEVLDICDEVVNIEMQNDVRSMNVGVAASIFLYHFKIAH